MIKKRLDTEPFRYEGVNGVVFTSKYSNLTLGVDVKIPLGVTEEQVIQDTTEMAVFHRTSIWDNLTGFGGYDIVQYRVQRGYPPKT
jgi:hypothetical protein